MDTGLIGLLTSCALCDTKDEELEEEGKLVADDPNESPNDSFEGLVDPCLETISISLLTGKSYSSTLSETSSDLLLKLLAQKNRCRSISKDPSLILQTTTPPLAEYAMRSSTAANSEEDPDEAPNILETFNICNDSIIEWLTI
ncbi:unnamed protein product [[Candida] boidinii]|uniref:Unnamed protein product n=1 Tax=Candida boidinii TaxID=5477 RepID=A0ACB5TPR0_CANBO|nr:unnamed protein product [[Candida] boidinii]